MKKISIIILLILNTLLSAVDFDYLTGSDLFIGVGAKQIGMGGTGSLIENSAASIYWNPAGLNSIRGNQLEIDLEIPWDAKNAIFIFKPDFLKLNGRQITIGLARINRLKFKGYSEDVWDGYSEHILNLSFNSISNFRGGIDTDTNDYRFAMAYDISKRFDFGFALIRYV
ncbi:MAG: hypothetical protein K9N09_02455 [Candidatus Cloacimonetes bacterium]|nr:hypothetical protein [Candidatus Cloacimonadota bacterium]MCF7813087.1 hypothetical protein [Candidatus Cloacimonadota bacterium]MCF7867536.1 hypothetical protein [Candidatus Cloacimonadota bacterium]MCF7883070.1 hypothetical protein [Candidatus Cloacimonadota bacterium]